MTEAPRHSVLGFSDAARWVACPGSVLLSLHYPETDEGKASEQGRALHDLAQKMIAEGTIGRGDSPSREDTVGSFIGDIEIDGEGFDAARMYADHCIGIVRSAGKFGGDNLWLESKVAAPEIHKAAWGTVDFALYDAHEHRLHVADAKFGWEIHEVEGNWQLTGYAESIVEALEQRTRGFDRDALDVELTIVQPFPWHRDGRIRTERITGAALAERAATMRASAHEALPSTNHEPRTVAGPHCKHCPARIGCATHRQAALSALDVSYGLQRADLPVAELGAEWRELSRARDRLVERLTALEESIIGHLQSGKSVEGCAIEVSTGRETWTTDNTTTISLFERMGYDVKKPDQPLTPNQAIKEAGAPRELVRQFTTTPKRGFKLVPAEKSLAVKAFSKTKG